MAVDAAVDALYMDNLDEFINDEDKVVTYRWLSTTLQVHVNQAKQMLYNFVTEQRNNDKGDNLNVTYFVAGLQKAEGEEKVHHCEVVSEDRLDAIKSKLSKLYSCHIYSVQKSKLQESNALYITDYNLMKENVFDACKYSSIKFDVERKIIEPKKPVVPEIKRETVSPSILDNGTSEKKKETQEKEGVISTKTNKSKTGIAGMFAKANSIKKESPISNEQNENPSKTETKETAKKNSDISKKQGGVMAFFNSAAKKTKPLEVKPLTTEKEPVVSEKKKNEKKKKVASSDSDDDFLPRKKKRRRIKDDMFDSSSEEEGLETEDPFANSPPSAVVESDDEMQQDEQKNKDKAASEDEKDRKNDVVDDDDDEEPIPDTPEQSSHKVKKGAPSSSSPPTPSSSSSSLPSSVNVMVDGRRRKRIKRKKKKTYLNDEGFMVTETVMESDSTDASDIEPQQQQVASSSIKDSNLLKNSIETKKLKAVTGVKAPADKGKQKQASLMSFFSKK